MTRAQEQVYRERVGQGHDLGWRPPCSGGIALWQQGLERDIEAGQEEAMILSARDDTIGTPSQNMMLGCGLVEMKWTYSSIELNIGIDCRIIVTGSRCGLITLEILSLILWELWVVNGCIRVVGIIGCDISTVGGSEVIELTVIHCGCCVWLLLGAQHVTGDCSEKAVVCCAR